MTIKEHIANIINRSEEGSLFFNNSFPKYGYSGFRVVINNIIVR